MISTKGIRVLGFPQDGIPPHGLHGAYHVHFVCLRGSGSFIQDGNRFSFSKDDLVILQGNLDFSDFKYSKGFRCLILAVPRGFLRNMGNGMVLESKGFIHTKNHPVTHLPGKAKELILEDFRSLEKRASLTSEYGLKSISHAVQVLTYDIWDLHENREEGSGLNNSNAGTFLRFQELAKANCGRERTVAWYAGELCVTPRKLSRICMSASGSGASEWIEHYSKSLIIGLLDDPSLSLDQISDDLHFSSRSFFTRYVKRLLGKTPSEYRSSGKAAI